MTLKAILPFYLCKVGALCQFEDFLQAQATWLKASPCKNDRKSPPIPCATATGETFQSPPRHQVLHDTDRSLPDTEHQEAW